MRQLLAILVFSFACHAQMMQGVMGGRSNAGTVSTPVDSPGTGSYGAAQTVTITSTSSSSILYTVDGSTPACPATGTAYSGGFTSPSSTFTLKAIGCNAPLWTASAVLSSVYTISAPAILGNNTTLGSDFGAALIAYGYILCGKWTTNGTGGTATSITTAVYNATASTYIRMAIYTDASHPASLVSGSDTGDVTITRTTAPTDVSQWTTGTISATLAPSTAYWLCMEVSNSEAHLFNGNENGNGAYGGMSYGAFPETFPSPGYKDASFAMFASY